MANQKSLRIGLLSLSIFLVLIVVPLGVFLARIVNERSVTSTVNEILVNELAEVSDDIEIDSLTISSYELTADSVQIDAVLQVPSDVTLDVETKNDIADSLSLALERDVDLSMALSTVVRVVQTENDSTGDEEARRLASIEEQVLAEASKISPGYYR